ncbi:Hpt domain-containing protein [Confluentibacter citreus]|uniref:Hpt domain-containing protein n=1 Tax=Confluentibacter citreus TaxID=2007307 RepID=UPI000C282E68|nr:Hpt domain-containing protein [Confluentibacter citreus]
MVKTTYKYIDLNSLRENTFGNVPIEREIMHLFIDMVDDYISVLDKELPNKNWNLLYDATHKIKPNISMFGIYSMESTIVELENSFRNEVNLETIEETAYGVLCAFKEIKKEVQIELNLMENE